MREIKFRGQHIRCKNSDRSLCDEWKFIEVIGNIHFRPVKVPSEEEMFTREQVSKIVDYCFHKHASFYRGQDAEVAIEEAIKSSSKAVKE